MTTTKFHGKLQFGGQIAHSVKPDPSWGDYFNVKSGFVIDATDKLKVSVFYDKRLDGPREARAKLLEHKQSVLFHVFSKEVPTIDWFVEAEPIGASRLGLVAYKTGRKAILVGTLLYDDNKFTTELTTVYPNVTNFCNITASVTVSHTSDDGHTTVDGKVEGQYSDR